MTLQHASTTQSLAAWGISGAVLTLRSLAASTLSFSIAGDFDAANAWAYGDTLTLRDAANVIRFVGRVRQLPIAAENGAERRQCIAEDVLGDLDRRTYVQAWVMQVGEVIEEVDIAGVVIFDDGSGGGVQIGAQLTAIISAAVSAGVSVQLGSIASGLTVTPYKSDKTSISMLEALRTAARYVPDLGTRMDYTTTPPTVHFTRRASATEHDIAVINHADQFTAQPLHDQKVNGVVISYERAENVSGTVVNNLYSEGAPSGADPTAENVLVHHIALRGSNMGGTAPPSSLVQTQQITTSSISASSFSWWEGLWPDLAGRNDAATLTGGSINGPSGVTKRIVTGAQPEWTGEAAEVSVEATFNGIINGQIYINKLLQAKVNASSLSSGTYTRTSVSGGGTEGGGGAPLEPVPSGLAALLYAGLGVLHFQGHHERSADEVSFTVRPGDAVNFTGTDRADLTTARAQVQSVELALDTATTRLEFGPPAHLSFGDYIELMRSLSPLKGETRSAERAGSTATGINTVTGAGMGPASSLIPTPTTALHPFKVSALSSTGNSMRVESGQIDGFTIPAETINVGSSRPVAIRIRPTFLTTVFDSEFFSAATLDTETVPPYLQAATGAGAGSDVVSMTEAGTEARCVIAIINTGNVIDQLALTNIVTDIDDDGSETGTAEIQFLKS